MPNGTLEAQVLELADREAIRDLARQYAHHVWCKDIPQAIALFSEDGEMDTGDGEVIRGRQALLDSYGTMLNDAQFHPFVHNHVVDIDGDSATGTFYLDLRAVMEGRSMIGSGFYEDRYARVDDAWKFRSRKLTMCYLVPITEGWAETAEED